VFNLILQLTIYYFHLFGDNNVLTSYYRGIRLIVLMLTVFDRVCGFKNT